MNESKTAAGTPLVGLWQADTAEGELTLCLNHTTYSLSAEENILIDCGIYELKDTALLFASSDYRSLPASLAEDGSLRLGEHIFKKL